MGKKEQRREADPKRAEPSTGAATIISRRGWNLIIAGFGLAALGYVVLSFTDSRGQNLASRVSPFLILAGYATMGAGILARDRS